MAIQGRIMRQAMRTFEINHMLSPLHNLRERPCHLFTLRRLGLLLNDLSIKGCSRIKSALHPPRRYHTDRRKTCRDAPQNVVVDNRRCDDGCASGDG